MGGEGCEHTGVFSPEKRHFIICKHISDYPLRQKCSNKIKGFFS